MTGKIIDEMDFIVICHSYLAFAEQGAARSYSVENFIVCTYIRTDNKAPKEGVEKRFRFATPSLFFCGNRENNIPFFVLARHKRVELIRF